MTGSNFFVRPTLREFTEVSFGIKFHINNVVKRFEIQKQLVHHDNKVNSNILLISAGV